MEKAELQVVMSRLDLNLVLDMRTDEAMRVIMRRLLEMMKVSETGVLSGADIECLHDFRIAVRRHRVLLGQIHGVMPQRSLVRLNRGFVWLGEVTRLARDLDVFLDDIEDYKNRLDSAGSRALVPLYEFFRHEQQLAHQHLVACLSSARYTQLIAASTTYLASPVAVHSSLRYARLPVIDWANQRIWRMLRRVFREGKAIDANSPPQALHELRKSCKKLRYLMEFFASLYPAPGIRKPIKALKTLQDVLGEYQDIQVQQVFLTTFQQFSIAASPALQHTSVVVDSILCRLEKRQHKLRKSFKQEFGVFVGGRNPHVFKQLFKP